MSREKETSHRIAILATGDEICHGDITNTNSQEIAAHLSNAGMEVRIHMVAPDTVHDIENAIAFLMQSHQALIITGGLGPTSDDLTRFALSKVIQKELIFNQTVWDLICARLKRFGYPTPPESNRQQALFPKEATIIPNPNGTAAGCLLQHNEQFIFMLPGPPNECLPMVNEVVLPTLQEAGFQNVAFHKHWFLFSVSEGKIAEELDLLAKPYDCLTGYRLFYPYIEFKIHSNHQKDFETIVDLIEKNIKPHLIADGSQIASHYLRTYLSSHPINLNITDRATSGALEAILTTPKTREHLHFNHSENPDIFIEGLKDYWEEKSDTTHTSLTLGFDKQNENFTIPYRGKHVVKYAVEFICKEIIKYLKADSIKDVIS